MVNSTIVRSSWTAAFATVFLASIAHAQWIAFTNETATRLANAPGNSYAFTTDPDEKDYAVGDVDNDGDPDLIVVRKEPFTTQGKRANYLFINEGGVLTNRTVQLAPQLLDLTNNRDVNFADVNGDGWLDVVTAPQFPAMPWPTSDPPSVWMPRVYMNLGEDAGGNWLGLTYVYADQRIPDFPNNQYPMFSTGAAGDADGDGDADLFFVDYATDSSIPDPPGGPLKNRLFFNDRDGFFTDVTQTHIVASGAAAIQGNGLGTHGKFADLNGDGAIDIVADDACSANPRTIRYARNSGSGVFSSTVNYAVATAPYQFDTGDLNNDGKVDFYRVDAGPDAFHLNNGNTAAGNPSFTSVALTSVHPNTTQGFGGNCYLADLDSDGWQDVVVADQDIDLVNTGDRLAVYHNLGNPPLVTLTGVGDPFTTTAGLLNASQTFDAAVLDINGDGRLDLVVGQTTGTRAFVQSTDTMPPTLVSASPSDGTIDVFQDRAPAMGPLQGITALALTFSEVLRDAATDGPVAPASFAMTITTNLPGLSPPQIASVTHIGATYTITLATPITPGAWTTVTPLVEDLSGNSIAPVGVDLGFLPGDVNENNLVTVVDLQTELVTVNACLSAGTCSAPEIVSAFDVNRTGIVSSSDVFRMVMLLNGLNTQNPWLGVSLPPQP